jgi:hypothetical protein
MVDVEDVSGVSVFDIRNVALNHLGGEGLSGYSKDGAGEE